MSESDTGQVAGDAAAIYEEFFVPALFAAWPAHVLAAAAVRRGDRLLDVACGTGILARSALETVGPEGAVTAVDINDSMLAVARSVSTAIEWRNAAAEALPFADGTFDRVVSQFALMFFQDRTQALREMYRVTRPGGALCIAVWAALEDTPGYAAMTRLLQDLFGPDVAGRLEAPYVLGDVAALAQVFEDAGLDGAVIQSIAGTASFPSLDRWLYTDIRGWTLAELIDDDAFAELRRAAPSKLNAYVLPDGRVKFSAPAHLATVTKPVNQAQSSGVSPTRDAGV